MIRLLEKDRLRTGKPQLILENARLSVLILPEIGGRILEVVPRDLLDLPADTPDSQTDGAHFLHRVYPQSVQFGPYTEYGGIEECIGSAPGHLWHIPWRVEKQRDGVLLSAISSTPTSKVMVQKRIALHDVEPIVAIEYRFLNLDTRFTKFTFGIHPELALCDDPEAFVDTRYCVPGQDGQAEGCFGELGKKRFIVPSEGWCGVCHDEKVLAMLFPENVIDAVEIYYPRVGTHLVMQPMIYGVGLSPNRRASFDYWLYFGQGDRDHIRALRHEYADELRAQYEVIPPPAEAIPGQRTHPFMQPRPRIVMPGEEFAALNHDPAAESTALAELAQPQAQVETPVPRQPATQVATRDFQFPATERTALQIIQPSGRVQLRRSPDEQIHISVRKLFERGQEMDAWRPEVTMRGQTLTIRVPGDMPNDRGMPIQQTRCEVLLPARLADVRLESVSAQIEVTGIESRGLYLHSEEGQIDLHTTIPADATYRVTSISGEVSIWLPTQTDCSLQATSVTGKVECDLALLESESTPHSIQGVVRQPLAELHVTTVDGAIRIREQSGKA